MMGAVLVMALSLLNIACSSSSDGIGDGGGNPSPSVTPVVPKPDAGNDLYGVVSDKEGNPLSGIVVSDGFQCVSTDARGFYQMKRNAQAEFVNYSIPSGYKAKSNQFYQTLKADKEEYNFKLEKLADNENHFYLLAIADPQVTNNPEITRFTEETLPDVKATLATLSLPVYGICLGDIVNNKMEHMKAMNTLLNSTTMPMFACIGNHDKDPQTDTSKPRTTKSYTAQFGPLNYSFNRGKVHFICLDNIIFSNTDDYVAGFTDEQVEWMRQDLQYVPKDRLIILYYHIPVRESNAQNREEILSLLKGYDHVKLMCGHTHYNQNYQITSPIQVEERITGAACGAWWHGVICADDHTEGWQRRPQLRQRARTALQDSLRTEGQRERPETRDEQPAQAARRGTPAGRHQRICFAGSAEHPGSSGISRSSGFSGSVRIIRFTGFIGLTGSVGTSNYRPRRAPAHPSGNGCRRHEGHLQTRSRGC